MLDHTDLHAFARIADLGNIFVRLASSARGGGRCVLVERSMRHLQFRFDYQVKSLTERSERLIDILLD